MNIQSNWRLKVGVIHSVFLLTTGCASAPWSPWGVFTSPTSGENEAIGSYYSGCLKAAVSLFPDGDGYQTMKPSRRRYYGHSDLIYFIENLGKYAKKKKLAEILIGDLAQPRGGPAMSGHSSHQNGLDVDVWFLRSMKARLTLDERENSFATTILDENNKGLNPLVWTKRESDLLKFAAEYPRVDRIFVDPSIKKNLCSSAHQGELWLQKIRPWWGHDDHFHVRLKCPEKSLRCKSQSPIPAGTGCDETLEWWFSEEAIKLTQERKNASPNLKKDSLPKECEDLLHDFH